MELHVVWTGSLERQAAEAERIYVAPPPDAPAGPRRACDVVRDSLRMHGPSTIREIEARTGLDRSSVHRVLTVLRRKRLAVVDRTLKPVRTKTGRVAKYHRLTEV